MSFADGNIGRMTIAAHCQCCGSGLSQLDRVREIDGKRIGECCARSVCDCGKHFINKADGTNCTACAVAMYRESPEELPGAIPYLTSRSDGIEILSFLTTPAKLRTLVNLHREIRRLKEPSLFEMVASACRPS